MEKLDINEMGNFARKNHFADLTTALAFHNEKINELIDKVNELEERLNKPQTFSSRENLGIINGPGAITSLL